METLEEEAARAMVTATGLTTITEGAGLEAALRGAEGLATEAVLGAAGGGVGALDFPDGPTTDQGPEGTGAAVKEERDVEADGILGPSVLA